MSARGASELSFRMDWRREEYRDRGYAPGGPVRTLLLRDTPSLIDQPEVLGNKFSEEYGCDIRSAADDLDHGVPFEPNMPKGFTALDICPKRPPERPPRNFDSGESVVGLF